jgi:HEAT repeat protein
LPFITPAAAEDPARRRRDVAAAGHTGDLARVEAGRVDADPAVRATALGALARLGRLTVADLTAATADGDAIVRRRACELAPRLGAVTIPDLVAALGDPDDRVVEAACFGLGELGADATPAVGSPMAPRAAVGALATVTGEATDPLCREAAVAALGAIGDPTGLPAILAATVDKPAVRRRAVLALAPFDGPDVDEALTRALTDRDWQVRQAAEDLTGPDEAPTDVT